MNKKMNILQLVSWYPDINDKENPSRGVFFQEQFRSLSELVDITVFVINLNSINYIEKFKDFWNIEKISENGFTVYRVNAIHIPKCIKCTTKYISLMLLKSKLKSLIQNCDLIHSHVIYPSGAIGYELSKKFNKPLIVTEHASYLDQLLKNKYLYQTLLKCEHMTAVSGFLKDKIISLGRSQCDIVPNYLNTNKYYFKENTTKTIQLLHISSMAEVKNIDQLLLAIKHLFESTEIDLELQLLGGGSNITKYKHLCKKLNLEENVTFVGNVSNVELRKFLSKADALIITSTTETFSVVGVEALASGIPVISTKCGGPEDYINNSTGLLINKITPKEIAKSIEIFCRNKGFYNNVLIKKYAYENFDAINVSKDIICLYKSLIIKKINFKIPVSVFDEE